LSFHSYQLEFLCFLSLIFIVTGATWHKTCFACGGCKKVLNLHNGIDHDGQPFCGSCHAKKFGPKGIGYGNTLGDTGIARMDE
jgi:hypothetical protein